MRNADLVVVSMHAGAEGSGAQHLTGADEIYYGENRGNPEAFARTAIDAGADLVLGSGPHVLRAMEFYKKRLIAYSLGDFAGYHNFGIDGVLGISAILRVKLDATGKFVAGRIVPVRLVGAGPACDRLLGSRDLGDLAALARGHRGPRAAHLAERRHFGTLSFGLIPRMGESLLPGGRYHVTNASEVSPDASR